MSDQPTTAELQASITQQGDRDTITARLAGVDDQTARDLGWDEAGLRLSRADLRPGDGVPDAGGHVYTVESVTALAAGWVRVRYRESRRDWHYLAGEIVTVRRG